MSLVVSTLLSTLLGAGTAILVTLAIGGILATLPSTIVPASFAICTSSATTSAARIALFTTPCGMLVDSAGFLFAWRVLPKVVPKVIPFWLRLSLVAVGSLAVWGAFVSAMWGTLSWSEQHGVTPVSVGPASAGIALLAGLLACRHPSHAPRGKNRVGAVALLSRGLLAGASIGASNVLAGTGESVLSGFAATFPAIFLSTMVSLWIAQGEAVPTGAVGPMMLGSVSVSTYSIVCGILFTRMPLGLAMLLSWVCASCLVSIPCMFFLRGRHAAVSRAAGQQGKAVDVEGPDPADGVSSVQRV